MSDLKIRWRLFADESEPTTRERGMRVYEELQRQGVDAAPWDLVEDADVIVLQYNMRDLNAALAAAPTVVSDINDMVFADRWLGDWQEIRAGFEQVDAIVAGSPRLYEHLVRLHPQVRMIEQPVGPQYWTVKLKKHEGLHLFWMGMTDNIIYFRELDPVLAEISQHYDFTVHFCTSRRSNLDHGDGCGRNNEARVAAKPYKAEFHEWSVDGALEVMAGCDIGIAPLFQNEWSHGKCANKALNMMATGMPVVVSDVPAYRAVIEHGVSGVLCYAPEDWDAALRELLEGTAKRKAMGKAGKAAAQEYTVEKIARQWAAWLQEVAR